MMERRRCPSAIRASASHHAPSASGPRCAMASVMARTACSGVPDAGAPRNPAIPHMSISVLSVGWEVQGPARRGRLQRKTRRPRLARAVPRHVESGEHGVVPATRQLAHLAGSRKCLFTDERLYAVRLTSNDRFTLWDAPTRRRPSKRYDEAAGAARNDPGRARARTLPLEIAG